MLLTRRAAPLIAVVALAAATAVAPVAAIAAPPSPPSSPLSSPSVSSVPDASVQIIGGVDAPASYRFAARLEVAGTGQLVCSAWVYDHRHIVTAAHCVAPLPTTAQPELLATAHARFGWWLDHAPTVVPGQGSATGLQARIGTDTTAGQVLPVDTVVIGDFAWGAPNADGEIGDVALLHTAAPILTQPALRTTAPRLGETVRVMGFGRTGPGEPPSARLRMVDTVRAPHTACPPGWIGTDEIAMEPGQGGAYFGDSGGPLARLLDVGGHDLPGVVAWTSRDVTVNGAQVCQIGVDLAAHKQWLDTHAHRSRTARTSVPS